MDAGVDPRVAFSWAACEKLRNDRVIPANGGPLAMVKAT